MAERYFEPMEYIPYLRCADIEALVLNVVDDCCAQDILKGVQEPKSATRRIQNISTILRDIRVLFDAEVDRFRPQTQKCIW